MEERASRRQEHPHRDCLSGSGLELSDTKHVGSRVAERQGRGRVVERGDGPAESSAMAPRLAGEFFLSLNSANCLALSGESMGVPARVVCSCLWGEKTCFAIGMGFLLGDERRNAGPTDSLPGLCGSLKGDKGLEPKAGIWAMARGIDGKRRHLAIRWANGGLRRFERKCRRKE